MQQHTQFYGASASGLAERDGHWPRPSARRWGSTSSARDSHGTFDPRAAGAAVQSLAATPTLLEATPTFITVRARARASRASAHERGAVLVEFALIVIAFYLLFAGTFEIGRMVFSAQILQNAARVGARELALIPLPATYTFDKALGVEPAYASLSEDSQEYLNVTNVRTQVYDPGLLAHDITAIADNDVALQNELASWPPLNKMLIPLMIRSEIGGATILHYPGAIVQAPTIDPDGDGRTVMIPIITSRGVDGVETVEWRHVVEEMRAVPSDSLSGPFSMVPASPSQTQQGLVALRINYPFQAATMTAFQPPVGGGPIVNNPVIANDDGVTAAPLPTGMSYAAGPEEGPYGGQYGLGKQYALAKEVRPFRRLLSAQSIFRREVFK
jgi:hypothetical protein